ncbi:M56 family metallopeptidase [Hymenobacter ginsengisoli]|uniref:M56 family metallopeptidase n=1 Tax=Hymenobacter ginsengisoli TaxID=1051626 RepID=A0ABP8PYA1_9BACT|nr:MULTISPECIES: M56 family metallopeptidase [unclassified Hymenobacter]MBO2030575.1 TonB family protein [Hymenobacter sp. BT559]
MDTSFLMGWLVGTLLPLGVIWLLFRLVLRRERCFDYNRGLLLLAPVVALVLPLLPRPDVASWLAPHASRILVEQLVARPTVPLAAVPAASWQPGPWLVGLYLLGVLVALGCLAYRYGQLRRATRHLPRERRPGYVLAYTGGRLPTSSFGHTIFWDDTADLTPAEATSVLAHELGHVRQGHSAEVLWLEIWRALLWFNPFAHLLLPALRLTHELLADWQALLQVASPADALAPAPYPSLLARLAARRVVGYSSLVQSFAFSFTLTRITMLQNEKPVRRWKKWLALPVLGSVFLASACQSNNDQPTPGNAKKVANQAVAPPPPPPPTLTTVPVSAVDAAGKVYTYVDQMPQLPDNPGIMPIVEQIQANLTYPAGVHQQGRVFVSFTVQADGSVGDTKVIKSLGPAYDEAVVAAIRKLPRFVPGKQDGQAVAVSFTVPVTFQEQP